MNTENKKPNKIMRIFSGKGFYALLAIGLFAVGVAGWSAYDSINNSVTEKNPSYSNPSESYNTPITSIPTEEDSPTENKVEDVPYSEPEVTTPTRPVATKFALPIKNGSIIKGFSETELQFSLTYGDLRVHLGTDIKAASNAPVLACGDGIIEKIYEDELLGLIIVIDHGNDILVKYAGLANNLTVGVGDTVNLGDKIGYLSGVPNECADEMHLHIEATKNGKLVDPAKTLNFNQ